MENEQTLDVPDYIKNRVDLKAETITTFATALNVIKDNIDSTGFKKNRAILITSFGHITCDIVTNDATNDDPDEMSLFSSAIEARNLLLAEQPDTSLITNNTSLIMFKNADVISFSNPLAITHFNALVLFADQIVGYTFGIATPNK
jgi:hypothetical protein